MLKVYLDNCCFSRPFDDISQKNIKDEAVAKMYIQALIKYKSLELYSSFMLLYEINQNPSVKCKDIVYNFINEYSSYHLGVDKKDDVIFISSNIMKTGIKYKDAVHLACSIVSKCNFFITTDKRVINYKTSEIKVVNPIEFVDIWRNIK